MSNAMKKKIYLVIGISLITIGVALLAYIAELAYSSYQVLRVFGGRTEPMDLEGWSYLLGPTGIIFIGVLLVIRSRRRK